jgi:RNA polymerase sigma-70 factor (ECF subfamily)
MHEQPIQKRTLAIIEERAFRAEVEPFLHPLRRQIGRMVPDAAIEDIVQETLLSAWRAWKERTLVGEGYAVERWGAWLSVMGRNKAIDWLRREGRSLPLASFVEAEHSVCEQVSPETRLVQHEGVCLVREAVAELPPRQRSVIAMRALQECATSDTAQTLSMAEKTVYATEADARKRLKHSPMMQEAWSLFCAVGAMVWAFWVRSQQALAHLFHAGKAASQAATWSKISVAVWTSAVGGASVIGMISLGPRPQTDVIIGQPATFLSTRASHLPVITPTDAEASLVPSETSSRHRVQGARSPLRPISFVSYRAKSRVLEGAKTMNMKTILATALIASTLLGAEFAEAKPKTTTTTAANEHIPVYRKVTKIDFEGTTLTGGLEKPMMSLYSGRRRIKMKSLITFRKHFRNRLQESAANL